MLGTAWKRLGQNFHSRGNVALLLTHGHRRQANEDSPWNLLLLPYEPNQYENSNDLLIELCNGEAKLLIQGVRANGLLGLVASVNTCCTSLQVFVSAGD